MMFFLNFFFIEWCSWLSVFLSCSQTWTYIRIIWRALLKHRIQDSMHSVSGSDDVGQNPRICIFNKLLEHTDTNFEHYSSFTSIWDISFQSFMLSSFIRLSHICKAIWKYRNIKTLMCVQRIMTMHFIKAHFQNATELTLFSCFSGLMPSCCSNLPTLGGFPLGSALPRGNSISR